MLQRLLVRDKKGELTTQQIVILVIIIISFIVLLYFLLRVNPGETSSKQICYNSVVLSSKGGGLIGNLDCKTNYLTIDDTDKEKVLKILADEIADCWWMFGGGNLDYVSIDVSEELKELFDASHPYHCAICSRVKFDAKTQDKIKEISYDELYNYMKTHSSSHDASQSYLKYLYGVNSLESSNTQIKEFDLNAAPISTSKEYLIITGQDREAIAADEYRKVQIISADDASIKTKTMCGAFDITRA